MKRFFFLQRCSTVVFSWFPRELDATICRGQHTVCQVGVVSVRGRLGLLLCRGRIYIRINLFFLAAPTGCRCPRPRRSSERGGVFADAGGGWPPKEHPIVATLFTYGRWIAKPQASSERKKNKYVQRTGHHRRTDQRMDGPTDGWNDQPTNQPTDRTDQIIDRPITSTEIGINFSPPSPQGLGRRRSANAVGAVPPEAGATFLREQL